MAAPTLGSLTSRHYAPVAATLAARKVIRAGQNLAQAGSGDLVQGRAGAA